MCGRSALASDTSMPILVTKAFVLGVARLGSNFLPIDFVSALEDG